MSHLLDCFAVRDQICNWRKKRFRALMRYLLRSKHCCVGQNRCMMSKSRMVHNKIWFTAYSCFNMLNMVITIRQLILVITLVSDICFSLVSTGTWNQTCFSSKNLVRLNVSPNMQTNTMIILVLLMVQIERASNGLQTTMNLWIKNMIIY